MVVELRILIATNDTRPNAADRIENQVRQALAREYHEAQVEQVTPAGVRR